MNLTGAGSGAACDYLTADGATIYGATYNAGNDGMTVAIAAFAAIAPPPPEGSVLIVR